jgi:hypothetical protein
VFLNCERHILSKDIMNTTMASEFEWESGPFLEQQALNSTKYVGLHFRIAQVLPIAF